MGDELAEGGFVQEVRLSREEQATLLREELLNTGRGLRGVVLGVVTCCPSSCRGQDCHSVAPREAVLPWAS